MDTNSNVAEPAPTGADVCVAPPPLAPQAAAQPSPAAGGSERRFLCALALVLLAIKAAFLLLDPQLRLFMGDSATYLATAVEGGTPFDRSFTYPLLIRASAGAVESIGALLALQTLFGAVTALLLCTWLRQAFGVRRWLAAAAALALACEPTQLFYERMVMTESAGTCALALTLVAAFAYLRSGRVAWLLCCIAAGVALASLRVGLVPLALALGVVAALLRRRDTHGTPLWLAHVALALIATFGAHHVYKHWYAARAGGEPAYIRDAGIFRLGLVAPLLKSAHLAATGLDPNLLDELHYPLADARFREYQIWAPDGLIDVLRRHTGGERVRGLAAELAARAIADDPLGVLRLGIETQLAYFDADTRRQRMWSDLGAGQPPDAGTLALLRARFAYDAAGQARRPSSTWTYFAASAPWLIACLFLLAPLGIAQALFAPARHARAARLLALLCVGLFLGHTLCSHIVSFRYLHPFPLLALACVAALAEALLRRRAAQAAAAAAAAAAAVPRYSLTSA